MGKVTSTYAVLYGYCLEDKDLTGYFAADSSRIYVTSEEELAKRFPLKKKRNQAGFGTPQQWCELINEDPLLNHGYKFHVVKKV